MVTAFDKGVFVYNGEKILGAVEEISAGELKECGLRAEDLNVERAKKETIAYGIIQKHNTSDSEDFIKIKFDALASHDITYVGIIQTAKASGLKEFPIPYVLTNCHNSLCAVGGTINEDDHVFGLSAAKKYGGIYVPAHQAVIHTYMREEMAACGKMILGSDSHTRYGALGTMAIGEGGPELVKQLLGKTYDFTYPKVVAVYLEGEPKRGVGPHDVALDIIGEVFKNGFVKNKVLEFIGPGVGNLSVDFRNGIDVMTTETTCLSSIWVTDEKVEEYYKIHGRPQDYAKLQPGKVAYYDGLVKVDLSKIEPMIALPFHPSNVYKISDLNKNPYEILSHVEEEAKKALDNPKIDFKLTDKIVDGKVKVDQGIIAGCAGGMFENVLKAAAILKNKSVGNDYFALSVYPASQPIFLELIKRGAISDLMASGANLKTAFCGPCFGAGDVPNNNGFSIRHTTRNFPNREGSKPGEGQISSVALVDALSIAATAANGGYLTPATEIEIPDVDTSYEYDRSPYEKRVYYGYGKAEVDAPLKYGPNICDWPEMPQLTDNILLKVASVIKDEVTTTDELIPSGETSSYRSNPLKLSEFTLSRKDPQYVGRAKAVQAIEKERRAYLEGKEANIEEIKAVLQSLQGGKEASKDELKSFISKTQIGSTIFALRPGDGSAREQAASCQRVLGASANIALEYATKRYRSNLINWGMLPFIVDEGLVDTFEVGQYIYIEDIKEAVKAGKEAIPAVIVGKDGNKNIELKLSKLTEDEKTIILCGCLINYYAAN